MARAAPNDNLSRKEMIKICNICLRASALLAESGARSSLISNCSKTLATGLGATFVGFRTGFASLSIAIASGEYSLTRMGATKSHGANHRIDQAVRKLVLRAANGGMTTDEVEDELNIIATQTPRNPPWLVSIAVGLACACFGRLFNVDWPAFLPVAIASGLGQYLRLALNRACINPYIVAALVSCFSAFFSGLGADLAGSETVFLAMIAGVLLLVPGIPATNAQADIMDGYPTMGSARAVSVLMIMVFVTAGVWIAQTLMGIRI